MIFRSYILCKKINLMIMSKQFICSFSVVAFILSQISECIQWNSLLMPLVVSEQQRL